MILQVMFVFFIIGYCAEGLPFSNMNYRPEGSGKMNRHLHRHRFISYPSFLRHPVRRFSRTSFGHRGSPIRQPLLKVSDELNQMVEKFDSFFLSRLTPTMPSVIFDQYLSSIICHRESAQKIRKFGEQIKDTVHHYGRHDAERIQHMKEILKGRFRLNEMQKRLQQIIRKKTSLMRNLDGMGWPRWHGKYVGIPYHTMNDDHLIVKKPGVNFHTFFQPNMSSPAIATSISAIQSLTTQYPGVPEVTTSVDSHQEWEVPEIIAGYTFPITSMTTYRPEVVETTEIRNSIGQKEFGKPQLSLDASNRYTQTTISMDPAKVSTSVLESNIIEIPLNGTNEPPEGMRGTIVTGEEISTVKDSSFGREIINLDTTTEIVFTSSSSSSSSSSSYFPSTSEKETKKIPIYSTPMLVDLLSEIRAESVTSSVINQESTTTKVGPTFPVTVMNVEEQFTSPMIDNEITVAKIITFPSTLSTDTILGTEEISQSQAPELGATLTADEISTIMDIASRGREIDPESTSEAAFSVLSTISTDTPITTSKFMYEIIDTSLDSSIVEKNINTRIVSSLPTTSTMSPGTTSWPLSASKMTSRSEISSKFGDDSFFSFLAEGETPSAISPSNETIAMLTEISTIFDPYNNNSTIEMEGTSEITSTLPSTFSTETSINENDKSTTADSFLGYDSAANNGKTRSEFLLWSLPTTISPKTTLGRLQNSEMTPLSNVVSKFKYDHFPTSFDEVETTSGYDSTLAHTIPATTATEILTTINSSIDNSTTKMEILSEMIPTVPSTILPVMEEKLTTTTPFSIYDGAKMTAEVMSVSPNTILPETTSGFVQNPEMNPLSDVASRFKYDHFSTFFDNVETTSGYDSTLTTAIPAETATVTTEILTTVDLSIGNLTIEMEVTMEMIPTVVSTISPEKGTIMSEESTTTNSFSTYNSERTITESMTLPSSTISPETTSGLLQDLEITPLLYVSSKFGYDRSPYTVDEVEITKRVYSTLLPIEETSTTTDSQSDSLTIDKRLTEDVLSTFSINETSDFEIDTVPDFLQEFGYNYFTGSTIAPETITEVDLTLISKIPNETTKMTIDKLTTIDSSLFNNSIIDMEIITENVSPSMIPTKTPTTSDEVSTTIDPASKSFPNDGYVTSEIDFMLPSTIFPETTSYPAPSSIITSPVVVLSRFGYDRFPSFIHARGETNGADITPHSTIQTETTTTEAEMLTTDDQISIDSTNDMEKKTEIFSTSPSVISTKTIETLDGKWLFNNSTFPSTYPSSGTETTVSEITRLMDVFLGSEYNYNSTEPIMTSVKIRLDSISSSTTPAETAIERFATSAFEDSTLKETVTIFPTIIPTKTDTSVEEISRATDPASDSFTVNSETTTEIASSLPTTISTGTTAMPALREQNFEYVELNRANNNKRNGRLLHANLEAWAPGFAYHYEEQSNEKILLNLIPLVIEELRRDNVTPEKERKLSQVFGDLWPLLKEESRRRHGELMNHELAIFLAETGHGISNTRMHLENVATNDYEKQSNRHGGSIKNIAEFLASLQEIRAPVESKKIDGEDKENKAQDDGSDYNNKYYYHHNENTERFSRYNNRQGPNIVEFLQHSQGIRLAKTSVG